MTTQPPGDDALVTLRNAAGDEASVSLHGAQLLEWAPAGAGPQLYRSPLARPAPGKSLRGGTPVCFPQFSDRGPLPRHGFVRNSHWERVAAPTPHAAVAEARFQVDSASAAVRWEHAFCLVLAVRLGPGWLELQLQAANTGRTGYAFTGALHTYLAVADVGAARVRGLQGRMYQDNADGRRVRQDAQDALAFGEETDRVYLDAPRVLELQEVGAPQRRVVQQGFLDTVVWNPGPARAATLGDMPPQDWRRMLCIEAAAVGTPVHLEPGKTWRGLQRLELPGLAQFDLAQAAPAGA